MSDELKSNQTPLKDMRANSVLYSSVVDLLLYVLDCFVVSFLFLLVPDMEYHP